MDSLATEVGDLVAAGIEQRIFPGAVWVVGGPDGVLEQGAAGLLDPRDPSRPMRLWVSPTRERWALLLTNKLYYSRDRGPMADVRNAFRRIVFAGA